VVGLHLKGLSPAPGRSPQPPGIAPQAPSCGWVPATGPTLAPLLPGARRRDLGQDVLKEGCPLRLPPPPLRSSQRVALGALGGGVSLRCPRQPGRLPWCPSALRPTPSWKPPHWLQGLLGVSSASLPACPRCHGHPTPLPWPPHAAGKVQLA